MRIGGGTRRDHAEGRPVSHTLGRGCRAKTGSTVRRDVTGPSRIGTGVFKVISEVGAGETSLVVTVDGPIGWGEGYRILLVCWVLFRGNGGDGHDFSVCHLLSLGFRRWYFRMILI